MAEGLTRTDLENTIKSGRKLTAGMREAVKNCLRQRYAMRLKTCAE